MGQLTILMILILALTGCGGADSTPAVGKSAGSGPTTLTGRVTDAAGKPVAGVMVVPIPRAGQMVTEAAITTNEDGAYTWHLSERGAYEITFTKDGYERVVLPLTAKEEKSTLDAKLSKRP